MNGKNNEVKTASDFERRRIISLVILHFGRSAADQLLEAVEALDGNPSGRKEKTVHPFLEKVGLYELEKRCGKEEAIKAVEAAYPELHQDYVLNFQTKRGRRPGGPFLLKR